MTDAKGLMAELRPLFHQMPEQLFIAFCGTSHIDQVDSDDTLIITTIVLVATIWVHTFFIRRQK